jgi:hypothetical protein
LKAIAEKRTAKKAADNKKKRLEAASLRSQFPLDTPGSAAFQPLQPGIPVGSGGSKTRKKRRKRTKRKTRRKLKRRKQKQTKRKRTRKKRKTRRKA